MCLLFSCLVARLIVARSSVAELRDAVEQSEGVPMQAQELTRHGRVLNDDWEPRGVDTLNGSSVNLGVRLLGAGKLCYIRPVLVHFICSPD